MPERAALLFMSKISALDDGGWKGNRLSSLQDATRGEDQFAKCKANCTAIRRYTNQYGMKCLLDKSKRLTDRWTAAWSGSATASLFRLAKMRLPRSKTHVAEKKLVQRDGKWTVKYVPPTVGAQVMRAMLTRAAISIPKSGIAIWRAGLPKA